MNNLIHNHLILFFIIWMIPTTIMFVSLFKDTYTNDDNTSTKIILLSANVFLSIMWPIFSALHIIEKLIQLNYLVYRRVSRRQ